jgi:hypothetical protein
MHPPSQTNELSALPESFGGLPESLVTLASSPELPLEDPLLDGPPLEEPLLEDPPLEEPLLDDPPLEEPPFGGAAPSLESTGLEAPGELVPHAGTRGAVTSAKPKKRTDRTFIRGG